MRRTGRNLALAAVLVGAGPAFAAQPAAPPAIVTIGANYVAKQLCSCLFVAGRPETSCRAEFKPRIDIFQIGIDRQGLPARASVTASLGPAEAHAIYERPYGCRPAPVGGGR
jgi:hypothetical protein